LTKLIVDAGTDRTANRLSSMMLRDDANPHRRGTALSVDRCRFPQPAVIGGTFARTQACRVLRTRPPIGFNLTRDGLVFFMARFQSRLPASLYVAGPFAMGYTEFYNFLIPLYGLSLITLGPRVCGLAAGGKRIRTAGPTSESAQPQHARCC
jgi:hypothetical protein